MSQRGSGKRWFKITALLIFALQLASCSVAELERFARENESEAKSEAVPGAPYAKTEILVPEEVISGGKRDLTGITGAFSRILVGPEDEIRFLNPVAVGGTEGVLYIVDTGVPADMYTGAPDARLNKNANIRPQREVTVFRYDLTTKLIRSIENVGLVLKGDPSSIYVKADGSFLLSDPVGKKVVYFSDQGVVLNSYSDPANLSRPMAVWMDEVTQEIYVADGSFSHVIIFDQFGKAVKAIGGRGTEPGKFRAITAMAMGSDGLYVLDRLERPVQVLSIDGSFQYSFGETQHTFPTAIAVDHNQLVFVSERSDNTIRVYRQGQLIATIGGGGAAPGRFRQIGGLWVNQDMLYVADSQNRRVQTLRINAPGTLNLPLGM